MATRTPLEAKSQKLEETYDLADITATPLINFTDRQQVSAIPPPVKSAPWASAAVDFIVLDTHQLFAIQWVYVLTSNVCAKVIPEALRSDVIDRGDRLHNSMWVNG